MQNVGILNLSNLCQSYPYPPHSLSKSLVSPSSLQKKKKENRNHQQPIFQNLFKQIDARDFVSLKGSNTRVCRNEWKESSSSRWWSKFDLQSANIKVSCRGGGRFHGLAIESIEGREEGRRNAPSRASASSRLD